ncbi:predicted protein [Streptomyces viridosporus ATCC 14672]|uniref:Predicted protein n=1 Tax=Streptomyces viridosporus (strain ATCC 14672 / DSM 40746 / JCM 4963 / KCTC 9882 / NRRL B-12104 / FH 1290) TaxID=566461 RepID=D6A4G0_STRV1|nr:hypothetical protein [Streptomyces viridosporus]EFE65800.1 predicted protein [Streptomyces viridosporus ATCC 14672]
MDRMKRQAAKNREAARTLRNRGQETKAKEMEARADALESGRVTDRTDEVSAWISWGFGRR